MCFSAIVACEYNRYRLYTGDEETKPYIEHCVQFYFQAIIFQARIIQRE